MLIGLRLIIIIEPGDDCPFVARCPALNLMTHGTSLDDVKAAADEMIRGFFDVCAEQGTLGKVLRQLRHSAGDDVEVTYPADYEPTPGEVVPPMDLVARYVLEERMRVHV